MFKACHNHGDYCGVDMEGHLCGKAPPFTFTVDSLPRISQVPISPVTPLLFCLPVGTVCMASISAIGLYCLESLRPLFTPPVCHGGYAKHPLRVWLLLFCWAAHTTRLESPSAGRVLMVLAWSTNAHSALTNRSCSGSLGLAVRSAGLATSTAKPCAREIATFRRLRL